MRNKKVVHATHDYDSTISDERPPYRDGKEWLSDAGVRSLDHCKSKDDQGHDWIMQILSIQLAKSKRGDTYVPIMLNKES